MAQRAKHRKTMPVVGYTRMGVPVFAIAGGSGTDAPPVGDQTGSQNSNNGADSGGSGDDDKDGGSSGSSSDTVSKDEHEAVKNRMTAADRRASQLETELEELRQFKKDKEAEGQSEQQRLQAELDETSSAREAAEARASEAEGKLGIVMANGKRKVPFRDPDDVLRYVDLSEVTTDKGVIDDKKLSAALDDLADKKPYLLSDSSGKDDDDDDDDKGGGGGQASGGTTGNKGKGKGGLDREALAKKFPALRR